MPKNNIDIYKTNFSQLNALNFLFQLILNFFSELQINLAICARYLEIFDALLFINIHENIRA